MPESNVGVTRTARILNIAGQKFGKLTAIRYSHSLKKKAYWLCSCECGKEITAPTSYLRCGDTKSCGCLHSYGIGPVKKMREHGIWRGMINRCHREKNEDYPRYGGRGITVCDAWRSSFVQFLDDMGKSPDGYTIERNDNDGPYSKENCRWATSGDQSRNKRNNVIVEINGQSKCVADWLIHFGLNKGTYVGRLSYGWDRVKALSTPVNSTAQEGWVVVERAELALLAGAEQDYPEVPLGAVEPAADSEVAGCKPGSPLEKSGPV